MPHNPTLIRFRYFVGGQLMVDEVARWQGPSRGWDPSRWLPKPPQVPVDVIARAEAWLR